LAQPHQHLHDPPWPLVQKQGLVEKLDCQIDTSWLLHCQKEEGRREPCKEGGGWRAEVEEHPREWRHWRLKL